MTDTIGNTAKQELKSFIERIERLEEQKAAFVSDIKDLFAQAKSTGFDTKAMRKILKLRKQDSDEWREEEAILATYMHALGMIQGDLFEERAAA